MGCTLKACFIATGIVAVISLAIGIASVPLINKIVRHMVVSQEETTDNSSTLFDIWADPDVPMYIVYQMVNVTNPHEVQNDGAKPEIEIKGPFVYNETRLKYNISWSEDKTKIYYRMNRTFEIFGKECAPGFVLGPDDQPSCSVDDQTKFTTVNYALLGLMMQMDHVLKTVPGWIEPVAKAALVGLVNSLVKKYKDQGEEFFMTRTAREILMGYDEPIFKDFIDKYYDLVQRFFPNKLPPGPVLPYLISLQVNASVPENDFRNTVFSGKGDITKLMQFEEWGGKKQLLNLWEGCEETYEGLTYRHRCNMLNGTEGTQFHPFVKKTDTLQVYADDILRSSDLIYNQSQTIKGIPTYQFIIADYAMKNESEYPPNCGFDDIGPSGVLNMTRTQNAPIFASKPHFLDADPSYRDGLVGLSPPVRAHHDTFLNIEPHTGSVLSAHQRLQVNVHVQNYQEFPLTENVREGGFYLPIMYADEQALVSEDLANKLKNQLLFALKMAEIMRITGFVLAGVFFIAFVAQGWVLYKRSQRKLSDEEESLVVPVTNYETIQT